MVRPFNVLRAAALVSSLGSVIAFNLSCSNGSNTQNCGDANATATRQDGQCCAYSINCQPGSICNDMMMEPDLYDSSKPNLTCIKVVCASNGDCQAPKTCSLEKICNSPVCQTDGDCSPGTVCVSGTCASAPSASLATSCTIVTPAQAVRQGSSIDLAAVAKNTHGVALAHIGFDWTSSNPNVIAVSGAKATGGSMAGTAMLTAKVTGNDGVSCTGVTLTNYPNVAAGMARVILTSQKDGTPVTGANVTIMSGGMLTAQGDATGAYTAATANPIDSVTIEAQGFQSVSILSPGTNDMYVPMPIVPDDTKAGGFRGTVDLSASRQADIQLGIAGPSIPNNILDFQLTSLLGDSIHTIIDAPELSLNMKDVKLPGGVLFGLGSKKFTVDPTRCQGETPTATQLGCYVARAPGGTTAAWTFGGQLKLSQVTGIANQLSSALGGGSTGNIDIGSLLTAVLPLLQSLDHGVEAEVSVTEFPKIPGDTMTTAAQCANPMDPAWTSTNLYSDHCRGDYAKYSQLDLAASAKLNVFSTITVPTLPNLPGGSKCAGAAVLVTGSLLPGRGLLPLGLTGGIDQLMGMTEPADCKVDGIPHPFGANSDKLMDGQLGLAMAAPHDGIEGSQIAMLLIALDPGSLSGDNLQINAVIKRTDSVAATVSFDGAYLPYPAGTLDKTMGTFTLSAAQSSATALRLQIENGNQTWLVYAPSSVGTTITVPSVAGPRAILTNTTKSFSQALKMSGSYSDLWTFGSGKTTDHLLEQVDAFVVQQCSTAAGAVCSVK
jgi:hypothetical protein